ncbi:hypothetical protein H7H37_10270, partial [Mycolicibacterium insubricum]|nr:hypothetical protein [Mycolicibacterium insubricum]
SKPYLPFGGVEEFADPGCSGRVCLPGRIDLDVVGGDATGEQFLDWVAGARGMMRKA